MFTAGLVFGAFGGIAGALIGLLDLREPELLAARIKSPGLWVSLAIQATLAGMVVAAYQMSGFKLNPVLCLNVGAATPAILRGFISQVPPVPPGRIG
ncbi:MAG TPA: hypothetical protein VHU83_11150 [Bryobacteraceae bacterium]|nr:hypothetical protein [Bryobacteraceae bacterium]